MSSKIAVRNIPDEIFRALETLADLHDRSTEAEARQALRAWVEPLLMKDSRNTRRKEIAKRLNLMLEQVNSYGAKLTPSHIAEIIDEEHAEDVEDWFIGDKEPSFSKLSKIACHLGVNQDWLKHGDKTPYPLQYERLPENPVEAVEWLLNWSPTNERVKSLHLIRVDNTTGELFIAKESEKGHFQTFNTPIHVSEEIGAGGEASLAALFVTLELLDKRDCGVIGYLPCTDDIAQLTDGNTHPGSLLGKCSRSTWWADIWDAERAPKHNYWPGWTSLHERIERVISARPRLRELRIRIQQGATTMADNDSNRSLDSQGG